MKIKNTQNYDFYLHNIIYKHRSPRLNPFNQIMNNKLYTLPYILYYVSKTDLYIIRIIHKYSPFKIIHIFGSRTIHIEL